MLAEVPDPAIVLLGAPGSGKSTLLRRLELETALAGLRSEGEKVTVFASLAECQPAEEGGPLPAPLDWLSARWTARYPGLSSLRDLLHNRRVLLLLDALNEMPHASTEQYRERVGRWRAFIQQSIRDLAGNRAVFTCRTLDYSVVLSSKEMRVPQARIEPLDDDRVQQFLQAYMLSAPEADAAWQDLRREPDQLDLFRVPFFLKILIDQVIDGGHIPEGRAQLFSGFVRLLLRREIASEHPLLKPDSLLTEIDHERLNDAEAARRNPTFLPDDGLLIPALTGLAYRMQDTRGQSEQLQIRMLRKRMFELLPAPLERRNDIFRAGCSLTVLDHDRGHDQAFFFHLVLQEFFAARQLATEPNPGRWHVEWREGQAAPVPPLADSDPLPPLPGTGWEEATVIAAGLAPDPEAFVRAVMAENLVLAARCAVQSGARLPEKLRDELRWALVKRTQDRRADLRARIAAGLALGGLGDPRFERRRGPFGEYLFPPLIPIPAGTYPIGSDEGLYEDEAPQHSASLAAFQIGQFPVTNAEYALFMRAGGYNDEHWWETDAAKDWRRGEGTASGPKKQWREQRRTLQDADRRNTIRTLLTQNRITTKQADDWEAIARMTDDQFEALLDDWYPAKRQTHPEYWHDEAYNNPAQPVVGICWHEARAYCAWLSAQAGQTFRLPTEAEREAAARGKKGRLYAYGERFDPALCNTFESHIRRTTPTGVFPGGKTPEGYMDLCGNTWDWTSSTYKPYPYDSQDGREDPYGNGELRVVRGGSWFDLQFFARAACRFRTDPGSRDYYLGFRVVAVPQ